MQYVGTEIQAKGKAKVTARDLFAWFRHNYQTVIWLLWSGFVFICSISSLPHFPLCSPIPGSCKLQFSMTFKSPILCSHYVARTCIPMMSCALQLLPSIKYSLAIAAIGKYWWLGDNSCCRSLDIWCGQGIVWGREVRNRVGGGELRVRRGWLSEAMASSISYLPSKPWSTNSGLRQQNNYTDPTKPIRVVKACPGVRK